MSITFNKAIIAVSASSSPATGSSFTPTAAGDQLFGISLDGTTSSGTPALTGTGGAYTQLGSYFGDDQGDTWGLWENLSASGSSQTCTVTSTAGHSVSSILFDYAGVSSISTSIKDATNSGGTGGILGTSVTVPVGSVLVAAFADMTGSSDTISSPSGTNRYSSATGAWGGPICVTEYAGTGAAIQPTATSLDTNGPAFVVTQFLLTPSGGGGGIVDEDPEYVIFVNAIRQRERLGIKRGWRRHRRSGLIVPDYSIKRKAV